LRAGTQRLRARRNRLRFHARSSLGEDHRVRGSKIGWKRFRGGAHNSDGITSIAFCKPKSSSHRCRPPTLLRMAPIDPQ
jgi:hypothetical protein